MLIMVHFNHGIPLFRSRLTYTDLDNVGHCRNKSRNIRPKSLSDSQSLGQKLINIDNIPIAVLNRIQVIIVTFKIKYHYLTYKN